MDVATHKSFGDCEAKPSRRTGHLLLFWGFAGAAVTSGLLIVAIYIQKLDMPLPLWHPYKILGNLSAVLLVVGGVMLLVKPLRQRSRAGLVQRLRQLLPRARRRGDRHGRDHRTGPAGRSAHRGLRASTPCTWVW